MRRIALLALLATSSIALLGSCVSSSSAQTSRGTISLAVDATDVARGVLHGHLVLPSHGGKLTLYYPKWIPGEHGPTGPILNVVNMKLSAGGKPIAWRRDSDDMFTFHVDVPPGVSDVEADLDYLLPGERGGFSAGSSSTSQLLDLSWNHLVLYPKGASDDWTVNAKLTLPAGWKYGTALPVADDKSGAITFKSVSLTTLVDSPLIAGAHFRVIPLPAVDGAAHELDIASDSDAALAMPPARIAAAERLVGEAQALFGAHHYDGYRFLLTLSDHVASFGLEHHQSSDNRVAERTLIDDAKWADEAGLLPHEFVHSWNGKFRRPEGLATPDYQTPMKGDLLWVYEGLTTYLGNILTPRSGLQTADEWRDGLASSAATLDHRPGRAWRSLEDTAVAAQMLYGSGNENASTRRGVDFYPEGNLLWLEVDVMIREKSHGTLSIDDFCKRFYGGKNSSPYVKPYAIEDVASALDAVVSNDWKAFLEERIASHGPGAPLGGIETGGWKISYRDTPSDAQKARASASKSIDLRSSLGIYMGEDGEIFDVVAGSAAAKFGLASHMKVIAINERRFSSDLLHDVIASAKTSGAPITFLTEASEFFHSYAVTYRDGERYPFLERDNARPDLLSEIIKPKISPPEAPVPAK